MRKIWAINCQVETNCTTLGYTSSKDEGNCLKCPFGNQWACLKNDSSGQEDTTPTPDYDSGEENTTPTPDYNNCKIGDILYSDMSCDSNVVASKTPIGVVFDGAKRLAIALDTAETIWSDEDFDVPTLSNYTISAEGSAAEADWQGKNNTRLVLEYCKANGKSCPAFEYVNSYKTEGTKTSDWYLPAEGELCTIYGNMGVLNTALEKIAGSKLPSQRHWSSTENTYSTAWTKDFDNGNSSNYLGSGKDNSNYIRPVLKFPVSSGGDDSDTDTGTCKIGDILYSDKTCSTDYDYSKTPIGLIFDSDKRRAMSIEQEKFSTWSTVYADAPTLPNIEDSTSALSDWNGKENTKAIAEYCKSKSYSCPAVEYISSYKTVGTSAGDWYLPALGELQAIYKNILILNYGLSKIYNREIPTDNHSHWSSTESGGRSTGIWALQFVNGEALQTNKASQGYILPVIKY